MSALRSGALGDRSLEWWEMVNMQQECAKSAATNDYKRAQRALDRSPEEKVKGHSGANNRDPQGHNLNNFGKGPFDDAIY